MLHKRKNPNKAFLIGSGILAVAVIFIVLLFTLLSLRVFDKKKDSTVIYTEIYLIEFDKGFAGDSISLYLNDSLLLCRTLPEETVSLRVTRFDETNALLVVDNQTDEVTTFNLKEQGGHLILRKQEGIISMTSMDW